MTPFDPRDDVLAFFELVEIVHDDGPFRFLLGADGVFTDVNGHDWIGSSIFSAGSAEIPIGGAAPQMQLSMAFIADQAGLDMIDEIRALGAEYVDDAPVRFYLQEFRDMGEMQAPALPPRLFMTRTARGLSFGKSGAEGRSITLMVESVNEDRRTARRITLDERGHEKLIGASNPSLRFRPTEDSQEELLFG